MKQAVTTLAAMMLLAIFSIPAFAQDEKEKEKEIKDKKKDV